MPSDLQIYFLCRFQRVSLEIFPLNFTLVDILHRINIFRPKTEAVADENAIGN